MRKIMFATILLIGVLSFVEPTSAKEEVLNGQAVTLVKPAYPPAAKAIRASGAVKVKITVNKEGKVVSATAVSGHPLLREASENAARNSTFKPRSVKGKRVGYSGVIIYNFYTSNK